MGSFIYYVLFSYMFIGIGIILWGSVIKNKHQPVKFNKILSVWSIGLGIFMIIFTIKWGIVHNISLWKFQPIFIITIYILMILLMICNILTLKK